MITKDMHHIVAVWSHRYELKNLSTSAVLKVFEHSFNYVQREAAARVLVARGYE